MDKQTISQSMILAYVDLFVRMRRRTRGSRRSKPLNDDEGAAGRG